MTHHQSEVPLAALADLGITSHRGRGWARDEIITTLADADCPPPIPGPVNDLTLDVAGVLLARAIADALPEPLELVDDLIWGPPGTDHSPLHAQAMHWRDQAAVGEIVGRTGLWSPPDPTVMPTVRIEARADEITADGRRIGVLATRGTAQYWAVYGVRPNGTSTWPPTSPPNRSPAGTPPAGNAPGSWSPPTGPRPCPCPERRDPLQAPTRWRSPRPARQPDLSQRAGGHLHAAAG